jgi:hypothetical protein
MEEAVFQRSGDLSECVLASQVFRSMPYDMVDSALSYCGASRINRRLGKFPDHLVVYYVVLMCLFQENSYADVFEELKNTLGWLGYGELKSLTDSAVTQARQRVGFEPLRELFSAFSAQPLAYTDPGASYLGYRITLLDGTILEVPDTPENEIFGRRENGHKSSAFPLLRMVALKDFHTRAALDVQVGCIKGSDEVTLAKLLNWSRHRHQLVLADRFFAGTPLCELILRHQSHFLFRVRGSLKLTPIEFLSDGSYTAHLRQDVATPLPVRVIEYKLDNGESYKIITSLMDETKAPAQELADLYHHRWTAETIFGEIKSTLRQSAQGLRSKSPAMVIQEIYGLLTAHSIIRIFMVEAAQRAAIMPKEISYKGTVKIVKRSLPDFGSFPP